jgi:hypothetical protein
MELGFVGLGRMGSNMVRRLLLDGHHVIAYNRSPEKTREIVTEAPTAPFPSRNWPANWPRRARSGSWSPPATPPKPRSTS